MPITVAMIEEKEFKTKMRGYDPEEVDEFLDEICDEMVAMQEEIATLQARLAQAPRSNQAAFAPAPAAFSPYRAVFSPHPTHFLRSRPPQTKFAYRQPHPARFLRRDLPLPAAPARFFLPPRRNRAHSAPQ